MRKHSGLIFMLGCLLLLNTGGCDFPWKKKTNWNVNLSRKSKNPYGSYLAFESLKYFFPEAKIIPLSPGFRYNSILSLISERKEEKTLFLALGLDFYLSQSELHHLISFIEKGNEVLVFARALDEKTERYIHHSIQKNGLEEIPLSGQNTGKVNIEALSLKKLPQRYGYPGKSLQAYFSPQKNPELSDPANSADSGSKRAPFLKSRPEALGFVKDKPDILRFKIGKGHLTLHAAPLVMSNYFLLQQENYLYLQNLWQ